MEKDDFGFKFAIGGIVTTIATKTLIDTNRKDKKIQRPVLFIVERSLQQCPGGTQRHYTCRSHSLHAEGFTREIAGFSTSFIQLNEVELEPLPEEAA